jgi:transcriptional regulator with XRE-family HTH domain
MKLGEMVRVARQRAALTQAQLARSAGTDRAVLSAYERGRREPSFATFTRLLAALDLQPRIEIERIDADIDADIDALASTPLNKRLAALQCDVPQLVAGLKGVRFVIEGPLAALLQGVPVPVPGIDIVIADESLDPVAELARQHAWCRWDVRSGSFAFMGEVDPDPRWPGPLHWSTQHGEIRLRVVETLPAAVRITAVGEEFRVRPLIDVELDSPAMARLLARVRLRAGFASQVASSP